MKRAGNFRSDRFAADGAEIEIGETQRFALRKVFADEQAESAHCFLFICFESGNFPGGERIRTEAETEDLQQEVFTKVFNNLASYNPRYAFSTWLYNIANNCCIDYLRKKGRENERQNLESLSENFPHPDEPHSDKMDGLPGEEVREIPFPVRAEALMESLPERYREVFRLRYIEHLKYRQIAETASLPMGTVKTYLFRAKALLNANTQKADRKNA